MAKITVTGSEKVLSKERDRQGRFDRLVFYTTDRPEDQGRPLWVTLPDETFTDAAADTAIRTAESARRLHPPRTLEI